MALGSGQGTTLNDSFIATPASSQPTSSFPLTLTSTPTLGADPTSTSTSDGGGGNTSGSGGFLSANGTPALILAFLAIGLFCGGAIALFGLRRYIRDRRDPNGRWARRRGLGADFSAPGSPGLFGGALVGVVGFWEKKPELWDYTVASQAGGEKWADIQVCISCVLYVV